ncbi:IS4 family transposase [Polaromonas sp.]|uniref:IS4 family transposase n=1 Tax=Polaromonas sp. TaxID=1869339 RepID=UPI003BB520EF
MNKEPVPRQTPPLNTVVRLIAQHSGILSGKHDGKPGTRTSRLGMQEIVIFVEGVRHTRQLNDV